jgi:hypothetical protein
MGYFDALTTSSFKTAQDGRRLYFPWGTLGRGYFIGSEQDYKRLEKQVKTFTMVSLILIIGLSTFGSFLQVLVVAALLIGFYTVRAWYLTRRLQRSDETLSLRESMAFQARAHSALSLWSMEIASLALAGGGILMFFVNPEKSLTAFAAVVFFGTCAAFFAIQLVQRNRRSAV